MEKATNAIKPGPRLNATARQLIRERISAGDSNAQIREALQAAGHPHNLTRAAINAYRRDPELKADIQAACVEGMQSAFAQRNERILFINTMLRECASRLISLKGKRVTNATLVAIGGEARAWLTEMARLVDGVTIVRAGANADGHYAEIEESQPVGFTIGMFNDLLEAAIREVHGDAAVDAARERASGVAHAVRDTGDNGSDPG